MTAGAADVAAAGGAFDACAAWPSRPHPVTIASAGTESTTHATRWRTVIASPPECEDEQRAAETGVLREIRERRPPLAHVERRIGCDITGDQRAHVTADSGIHRDVLLPVRPTVRHRVADDAGAHLELPERLARARVGRLEPPVERAVEHHVARR